jgi:hypothetical protein
MTSKANITYNLNTSSKQQLAQLHRSSMPEMATNNGDPKDLNKPSHDTTEFDNKRKDDHDHQPQRIDPFADSQTIKAGIIEARKRREQRGFDDKFGTDVSSRHLANQTADCFVPTAADNDRLTPLSSIRAKGSAQVGPSHHEGIEDLGPGAEFVPWGDYGPPRRNQHDSSRPSEHSRESTAISHHSREVISPSHHSRDVMPSHHSRETIPSHHSGEIMPSHHSRDGMPSHHSRESMLSRREGHDEGAPQEFLPSQHPRSVQEAGELEEIDEISSQNQATQTNDCGTAEVIAVKDIEQAIASESNPTERRCRPSRRTLIVMVAFLVIVTVAVVVATVMSGRNSSEDQSVTTTMDPPTLSCDGWYSQTQPNVITQCACVGKITIVADDVAANYQRLQSNGFVQAILPGFGNTLDSCDPTNQALVWLASATGTPSANANLRQRYVLALLYIVWNGVKWQLNTGWQSSNNECTWTGVTCDVNNVVNVIDLHNNGVTGRLGSYVPLLTTLTSLLMDQNSLQGSLAPQISSLSNLNMLVLEYNQLTGTLPSALMMLSQLQSLQLGYNLLSGTIPTWFGQMQSLTTLSLSNNTLGKGVSEGQGGIAHSAGKVKATAFPTELGLLTNLQVLELGATGINGTLPSVIFNLGNSLQVLDVSGNFVSGTIPTLVGNLAVIRTYLVLVRVS